MCKNIKFIINTHLSSFFVGVIMPRLSLLEFDLFLNTSSSFEWLRQHLILDFFAKSTETREKELF